MTIRKRWTTEEIFGQCNNRPEAPYLRVCAPMVRYSKQPFRELIQEYSVDLTYTPMILSDVFKNSSNARNSDFSTSVLEGPLVVQFAANKPKDLSEAAQFVARYCDAVDINCGCPQKWAIEEGIGSALMKQPQLIKELIRGVKNSVDIPCSIKIRVHKDLKETLEIVKRAEQVGVEWIGVHGRLVRQSSNEPVNLDAIKFVKENSSVPILANGDVFSVSDANRIVEYTGVNGVMSARGLLSNPALFSGYEFTPKECIQKYVRKALDYGTTTFIFHHHLMYMMENTMSKAEKRHFNVLTSIPAILDHLETYYGIEC